MERTITSSSVEFLRFLADISNPVTGQIDLDAFAEQLGIDRELLVQHWRERGGLEWSSFADETLAVLDAAHDLRGDLRKTIDWYLYRPLKAFDMKTAEYVVASGYARLLERAIKKAKYRYNFELTCNPRNSFA